VTRPARYRGPTLDDILPLLAGVRSIGPGGWVARCPVPSHGQGRGDRNPSLSVSEGTDGLALVHCFAGCEYADILEALGFSNRGPRPPFPPRPAPTSKRVVPMMLPDAELKRRHHLWERWRRLLPGSEAEQYLQGRRIPPAVAQAAGVGYCPPGEWPGDPWPRVVFPLVRLIDGKARLINLAGRIIEDHEDAKRWLYMAGPRGYFWAPAAAVKAEGDLIVVEGPADALALAAAGNPRSVAIGGTSGLDPAQLLGARRALVLPDNDAAGKKARAEWTEVLRAAGMKVYWVRDGFLDRWKDAAEAWEGGLDMRVLWSSEDLARRRRKNFNIGREEDD